MRERRTAFAAQLGVGGLLLLPLVTGCGSRRPARFVLALSPAQGSAATCPDDAVDPYGDGRASPLALRCSYDDSMGPGLTRIRGTVVSEPAVAEPDSAARWVVDGLTGVRVDVHPAPPPEEPEKLPDSVTHTTTDAQGSYFITAYLKPGDYVVVVSKDGRSLARRPLRLEGRGTRSFEDLRITVSESALPDPAASD